jgi:Zn-dependent M16 (insulinase) family peptidase
LRSCFREADWAAEQIGGISYLYFLRDLEKIIEDDWPRVLSNLEQVRNILVNRANMIVNVTADKEEWPRVYSGIRGFIEGFPSFEPDKKEWPSRAGNGCEGIIIPSQVNYVAKGGNVYDSGYEFHGSIHVICRFLRATWLWEQVRVRGGAYGVFCSFDRLSGTLAQLSYRDPDILGTVSAFDRTGDILRNINIDEAELVKSIIGTIGAIDSYMLPDAKGYTSMLRRIANETDEERQLMRDQILSANAGDFKRFADVLDSVRDKGLVKIVGPENSIDRVNKERPGWLNVLKGV